jgi:ribosomal-protein-alanine N-acetyltransferase
LLRARLRPALEEDIEAILDLHESVAQEGRWIGAESPIERVERSSRWREKYFGEDGCMFVAEIDTEIIGSASLSEDRGLVDLGMSVRDGYRRRGVGSALLEACVEWAKDHDAHKVTLQVWPHNEPALQLYGKFGFQREGYLRKHYRRKNGELWDVILMALPLEGSSQP